MLIKSAVALLLIALFGAGAGLAYLRLTGGRMLSVQTASMAPTFRPGDAVLIRPAAINSLRPGQIISYRDPRSPRVIITHRLVKIDRRTGQLVTAGDARHSLDVPFPPQLVEGRAELLLPRFGYVLDILRHPAGLGLAVYLPALTIIAMELRRLAALYARPFYSVRL